MAGCDVRKGTDTLSWLVQKLKIATVVFKNDFLILVFLQTCNAQGTLFFIVIIVIIIVFLPRDLRTFCFDTLSDLGRHSIKAKSGCGSVKIP